MARRKLTRQDDDLPANNRLTRQEQIEPVVQGRASTGSRGNALANKLRNIGNGLFLDIIVPGMKTTVWEFIETGLHEAIFGQQQRGMSGGRNPQQYHRMHNKRRTRQQRQSPRRPRVAQELEPEFQDIFYASYSDAQHVLGRLIERIAQYNWVSYGDLYALSDMNPNPTLEAWGWESLPAVRILTFPDGYVLDLPEPIHY